MFTITAQVRGKLPLQKRYEENAKMQGGNPAHKPPNVPPPSLFIGRLSAVGTGRGRTSAGRRMKKLLLISGAKAVTKRLHADDVGGL